MKSNFFQLFTTVAISSSLSLSAFAVAEVEAPTAAKVESQSCSEKSGHCTLDLGAAKLYLKRLDSKEVAYDIEGLDTTRTEEALKAAGNGLLRAGQAVSKGTILVIKQGGHMVSYVVEAVGLDKVARESCRIDSAYCDLPLGIGNANLGNVRLKRTGHNSYDIESLHMAKFMVDAGDFISETAGSVVSAIGGLIEQVGNYLGSLELRPVYDSKGRVINNEFYRRTIDKPVIIDEN
jgi:hypothetical protein